MTPRRKRGPRRKPRGGGENQAASDLFLPLPSPSGAGASARRLLVQQLVQRLVTAGYQQVAFTHTVYGKPKDPDDRVDVVLSKETLLLNNPPHTKKTRLQVLRRLHVVIENLSDVAYFTSNQSTLLNEYDIVSIAPRNEAVFRSVLESATQSCDVVTLDYTLQKSGLPYKIRPADMRTVQERNLVLEIPYAAAVLHSSWRKSWIQVGAELQQLHSNRQKGKPFWILWSSSGERKAENRNDNDAATLAIRMPRDVQNLATTVLGLPATTHAAARFAIERAQKRRFGVDFMQIITHGQVSATTAETETKADCTANPVVDETEVDFQKSKKKRLETDEKVSSGKPLTDPDADDEDAGDGFISF